MGNEGERHPMSQRWVSEKQISFVIQDKALSSLIIKNKYMTIASVNNVRFMYKNVKIDDNTKEYILKRLEAVDKVIDNILHKEVEIDMDKKGKFRVEVMVKTPYDLFRAEETTESIEGSIDLVVDELKIQMVHEKGKRKTLIARGARSIKKKVVVDESARF